MRRFEEIDHTADLAMKVEGDSLQELFLGALEGMYHLIFGQHVEIKELNLKTEKNHLKPLLMSAPTLEDLLVLWLSDMNYKIEVYQQVLKGVGNLRLEEYKEYSQLEGKFAYSTLEELNFMQENEIKAVTYHQLEVRKKGNLYFTTIIFDV
jgi:SHS2 domain-containing protein